MGGAAWTLNALGDLFRYIIIPPLSLSPTRELLHIVQAGTQHTNISSLL